ncbi:NUDIX hydrolase [Agarivorans sp. QJM3NY_25]|uniref:NUDIX hydrolase n=1 Tax=Agarivorans sp. QJM3NY_25 TaxID=3421430 RepID=UPI003D7CA4DD
MNRFIPQYCPQCGQAKLQKIDVKQWSCNSCQFVYFHNMASTAGAILLYQQQVLLVSRAVKPQKGDWDLPGGFVEYGESLEQGLQRELYEELQLSVELQSLQYFGSFANRYHYKQVLYHTCDSFFSCKLNQQPNLKALDDVATWQWHPIAALPFHKIAFSSVHQALLQLQTQVQTV